jgi:ACS family tartrate transporter-like MFS transporter
MLLGIVAFFYLTDKPKDAEWLTPAERTWLQARLDGEQAANNAPHNETFWRTLRHPRVLALGAAYFGVVSSLYGVGFWLPQIVQGFGYGVIESGFVTAIPYVCAAIAMVVWSRHSDRKVERFWHTALPALAAAMGLAASGYAGSPTTAMLFPLGSRDRHSRGHAALLDPAHRFSFGPWRRRRHRARQLDRQSRRIFRPLSRRLDQDRDR